MNLIFLSERDLSVLDYAYATDDYEIVLDSLVPQKSTFKVNKKTLKAKIGDYLTVRDNDYSYLGIITSIDEESNGTIKVSSKDFLSKFDVKIPVFSYNGNISIFVKNLIDNHFKSSGDTMQNLPYLDVVIESSANGSLVYENDEMAKILDLIQEFSKTYGIRLTYELKVINGVFSKVEVKVCSVKRGVRMKSDLAVISDLKISDINESSANKVIFAAKSDNTTYKNGITYFLSKDGEVSSSVTMDKRITPVVFKIEKFSDSDYPSLKTKATSILVDSSLEHSISFDFAFGINKVDSFKDLSLGTFIEFITPGKTYSTIVTKITYKGTFKKATLMLGEYRATLTDKLKLLQRKEK